MSFQGFVHLQMMMIRAEYPKVNHYLHEEKQKHLESLAVEGKIVFNQLRRNVARMRHRRKPLRKMYEELKEICCKTDVDLNQVKAKERCQGVEHQTAQKSFMFTEVYTLGPPLFSCFQGPILPSFTLGCRALLLQYNLEAQGHIHLIQKGKLCRKFCGTDTGKKEKKKSPS